MIASSVFATIREGNRSPRRSDHHYIRLFKRAELF
jgi:hypothetical protein